MLKNYAVGQSGKPWVRCVSASSQKQAVEKYKALASKRGEPKTKIKAVEIQGCLKNEWIMP